MLRKFIQKVRLVKTFFKCDNDRVTVRKVKNDVQTVVWAELGTEKVDAVLNCREGFEDEWLSDRCGDFSCERFLENLVIVKCVGQELSV